MTGTHAASPAAVAGAVGVSATPREPSRRRPSRPLLGVILGATLLTRLPGLISARAFNPDEATLAVGGRVLAGGGKLYVDFLDRKPPLPFAVYGVIDRIFGTDDLRPVRAVAALLVVAAAVVVADEADRRWGRRASWVAGLTVVLGASALGAQDAQPANFELFALLPIAVAVVAAARGRAILAGAALAGAVLCKQPAAVTALPVAFSLWRLQRGRGVLVGAVASVAAGVALAAPFGIGRVLQWALLGTGGYLGLSAGDLGLAAVRLIALAGLAVGFWGGAWLLTVAAGTGTGVDEPAGAARGRADVDLWLLLGASFMGVVAGFRFFPHYLLQLLPAVALLAGRGASRRPAWVRPAAAWGVAAAVVALALASAQALNPIAPLQRRVPAYVRSHSRPGDTILVWGNVPEIYWRSGRDPAGGFSHTEFVTGYSGGRRHQEASQADVPDEDLYRRFLTRLRQERPVLVVDTAAPDERGGRWFPLRRFPALTSMLEAHYRRVATVEGAPIYRLDDGSAAPSPRPGG